MQNCHYGAEKTPRTREPSSSHCEDKIREILSILGEATAQELIFNTCTFSPRFIEVLGNMVSRGEISEAYQQDPYCEYMTVSYSLNEENSGKG